MKQYIFGAIISAALVFPMAAQAEGDTAFYVGASAGRAEQKLSVTGGSEKDSKTGYKAFGGYQFNKNVGVEIGYVDFGNYSAKSGNVSADVKTTAAYAAVVGTYPLNEQFSLFAKAGATANQVKFSGSVGSFYVSEKKHNTAAMFGIGAAYNFSKNLALVGEYETFGKVLDETGIEIKGNMASVGLRYAF